MWRHGRQCRRHRPEGSLEIADPAGVELCYTCAAGVRPDYAFTYENYAGWYQTLYLYTGKEWVAELQGYEFGARVYDPVMGMWWGRDKAAQFWSPFLGLEIHW